MKENGKRREWVKTAAIVFLSVMLVLTFFSNTIMNYSLPEVATQYVMSGSITAKIRGTGTVESGDPYNVKITESRKIASVAVRVGDEVQKGDILMYLEDADSEELKAALAALEATKEELKAKQDALADARDAYDRALLNADISTSDIQAANGGVSASTYRSKVTEYQNAIAALENELVPLEQRVAELEKGIADVDAQEAYETAMDSAAAEKVTATRTAYYHAANVSGEGAAAEAEVVRQNAYNAQSAAEAALNTARSNLNSAKTDMDNAQSALDAAQAALDADPANGDLLAARDAAQASLTEAQGKYRVIEEQIPSAENDYNNKKAAYDNLNNLKAAYDAAVQANQARESSSIHANLRSMKSAYTIELYSARNNVESKNAEIAQKQSELADMLNNIDRIMSLEDYLDSISKAQEQVAKAQENVDKAQEEVDKQTANSIGATVVSPIAGTVTVLNVQAGDTTYNDMTVAVMQPEGRGYTLSFSVTNDQARNLSVGDRADLVNAWRYDDVTVTLLNIKPDTTDPGQKKLLTFEVTGNVIAGQSLSVSVGQKSANYDYIVPNSAIREDNNGKFILIVTSKAGPLSTRYIASRVDVEVLASDDTQSAIQGALNNYDFVITTSTKPVEAGKQVRLSGN